MLAYYKDWSDLFKNFIRNDEVVFHIGRFVSYQNSYYWAGKTSEKTPNQYEVTVWCGMTSDSFVGPFIFRDIMNAERCLTVL